MTIEQSIVINGDLGSGKTTVSVSLADRLGIRRISIGDLFRELASRRGVSALEINLHAQLDDTIDDYIDQLQRDIAASGERLVVDSRLAWYFFTDALKVHLITEPTVAATRVLGRPTEVENYATVEEARSHLASRSESERFRFLTRYGADKLRLRNYDLICDTTRATPADIVEQMVECAQKPSPPAGEPVCHLDPQRIFPTADLPASDSADADQPLAVGHSAPHFFVVRGHRALSAAVRSGQPLVRAELVAEGTEEINGAPCNEYFRANVTSERVRAWEQAHHIDLPELDWATTLHTA